jgi:signal transduction histidine kinase
VFFKDRTGYYLACNGAMARFAEKSREELIGKSALNWAGPLTARELDSQDTEVFASEGIRTYELELSDSTGTPRSIRIIKGCVRNEHGEATGLVGVYVDITQERNLLQAMSAARHEAEKAVRIKCDLMSAVSHEMRTPLTAIVLLAEAQLGGSEFPGDENLLLHEASTRLLGIVENIITLTGIESGMLHCENASFSATEMINAVYAKFLPTAREKQLSFVCDIDTGIPPRLQGDRAMIEMVLRHILSNAFKFTTVGSVTLSARMSTGEGDAGECMSMLYTVSDTGCGIASDLMEHLFDPFWQEDQSATRAYGGLGLGLPIVKRLVHSMGGRVEISALTEAGTMVRVFVPLTLAPESASENAKEAE